MGKARSIKPIRRRNRKNVAKTMKNLKKNQEVIAKIMSELK